MGQPPPSIVALMEAMSRGESVKVTINYTPSDTYRDEPTIAANRNRTINKARRNYRSVSLRPNDISPVVPTYAEYPSSEP